MEILSFLTWDNPQRRPSDRCTLAEILGFLLLITCVITLVISGDHRVITRDHA